MRGQKKTVKSLKISGKVFLQYVDNIEIAAAEPGDVLLYLSTEAQHDFNESDYYKKYLGGYLKADIFDGKAWCSLLIGDLCEDKENYFSKTELAIDRYHLCKEIIEAHINTEIFRSYRLHYSTYQHVENPYKGKKATSKKKK